MNFFKIVFKSVFWMIIDFKKLPSLNFFSRAGFVYFLCWAIATCALVMGFYLAAILVLVDDHIPDTLASVAPFFLMYGLSSLIARNIFDFQRDDGDGDGMLKPLLFR